MLLVDKVEVAGDLFESEAADPASDWSIVKYVVGRPVIMYLWFLHHSHEDIKAEVSPDLLFTRSPGSGLSLKTECSVSIGLSYYVTNYFRREVEREQFSGVTADLLRRTGLLNEGADIDWRGFRTPHCEKGVIFQYKCHCA